MSQALLPKRRRGRQSAAAEQVYREEVRGFCETILEIRSRLDFTPGSRGWCYLLEEHGLSKADFDRAQALIGDCRKRGLLPLDIVAEDDAREFVGLQRIDYGSPLDYAESIVAYVQEALAPN